MKAGLREKSCFRGSAPAYNSADITSPHVTHPAESMQHLFLRILVALLVGVFSPVCCCHIAAAMGTGCGAARIEADGLQAHPCCGRSTCGGGVADARLDSSCDPLNLAPVDENGQRCPSCSVCEGAVATVEPTTTIKPKSELLTDVGIVLAFTCPTGQCDAWRLDAAKTYDDSQRSSLLRSGRDVQRWQCALTI